MPVLYALNLTADLSGDSTGFFNDYANNGQSRCWVCSPNAGQSWSACNGGNNNSDNWGPTLNFSRGGNGATDSVQFAVFYVNLPSSVSISSASIIVTLGRQGRTNSSNAVASPFQNGSNTRTVLNDPPAFTTAPAYFIGPYTLSVNQVVSGNGILKFEFAIAAVFTLSNGQVYQFGYDPELDVDVGN